MNAPVVRFVGYPDGPRHFIAEFGCEVGTFTVEPGGKRLALMHHVPLNMRGDYRPEELANYDAQKTYRTDPFGKMLCYAKTKSDERCNKRAVNRFPRCDMHGGRLHPLDKLVRDGESDDQSEGLSRHRQFVAGQIGVDDLDDEELAACGFRSSNGRIYKPRTVPREMAQAFTRAIYERANAELRSNAIDSARTIAEIMKNKNVEPDIRLKAAITLLERNLGKTPQVVAIAQAKAYEEIFDDILHTRSERVDERKELTTIDAEVVEPERHNATESIPSPVDGNEIAGRSVESRPADHEDATVVSNQASGSDDLAPEFGTDSRLFERNEAILAQTIEIKPFDYDLTDHSAEVQKATRRRFATRALGDDADVWFIREETPLSNGNCIVTHRDPSPPKPKAPTKSADSKRKAYTLNDFG